MRSPVRGSGTRPTRSRGGVEVEVQQMLRAVLLELDDIEQRSGLVLQFTQRRQSSVGILACRVTTNRGAMDGGQRLIQRCEALADKQQLASMLMDAIEHRCVGMLHQDALELLEIVVVLAQKRPESLANRPCQQEEDHVFIGAHKVRRRQAKPLAHCAKRVSASLLLNRYQEVGRDEEVDELHAAPC